MNVLKPWKRLLIGATGLVLLLVLGMVVYLFQESINEQLAQSILTGITTSVIGSLAFILLMLLLKPNIEISDNIAYDTQTEPDNRYVVKVINKSFFWNCLNMTVNMTKVSTYGVSGGRNAKPEPVPLVRNHATVVPGRCWCGDEARYAQLFATHDDLSTFFKGFGQYIEVEVAAKHSLSGFVKVYNKKFPSADHIKTGKFVHGNTMDIK